MKWRLFLFVIMLPILLPAQSDYRQKNSLALHTDVFDVIAKGASLYGSYTFQQNRIFIAGGRNELPAFLNPQGGSFREVRTYFIQSGYYRFLPRINGLFIGVEAIFQQMEISVVEGWEMRPNSVLRMGPVIGYEWLPFPSQLPGLSVTPWISERFPLYSRSLAFSTTAESYKTADFNFVMGLNLGYRLVQWE